MRFISVMASDPGRPWCDSRARFSPDRRHDLEAGAGDRFLSARCSFRPEKNASRAIRRDHRLCFRDGESMRGSQFISSIYDDNP